MPTQPSGRHRTFDLSVAAAEALRAAILTAPHFISSPPQTPGEGSSTQLESSAPRCDQTSAITEYSTSKYHRAASRTSGSLSSWSSTQTQVLNAKWVYLCVKNGNKYQVSPLSSELWRSDMDFFKDLKTAYRTLRGLLKRCFSMWQYNHCEFFRVSPFSPQPRVQATNTYHFGISQFRKYGVNLIAPDVVDFPDSDNHDYEFSPRPMDPKPPEGPISQEEFYDHFYRSCHPCHTWHMHRRQQLLFTRVNTSAMESLPKRKMELEMDDGKREAFWGLYAIERRCFAWVLAYTCLCNLPGVIFFFLYLFAWKHGWDLQDAAVPIQLSLSLTVAYAALLYESREGKRR